MLQYVNAIYVALIYVSNLSSFSHIIYVSYKFQILYEYSSTFHSTVHCISYLGATSVLSNLWQ